MSRHDAYWESRLAKRRHLRLAWYLILSLVAAMVAYYRVGFDRQQAVAYAIAAYVVLVVLNFRAVLSRVSDRRG
jgi:hypothetical protein